MSADKLVMMANQIGKFFVSQGKERAVSGILDHLKKFWDPRMRGEIIAHLRAGGAGLDPEVWQAVEKLAEEHEGRDKPKATPQPAKSVERKRSRWW